MRRLSVYRALIAAVILLPALFFTLYANISYHFERRGAEEQANRRAEIINTHVTHLYEKSALVLNGVLFRLRDLSFEEIARSPVLPEALWNIAHKSDHIAAISVIGPDGTVVATSSGPSVTGLNVADREYFQAGRSHRDDLWVGTPVRLRTIDRDVLPVVRAFKDSKGAVGVLAVFLERASLHAFLLALTEEKGHVSLLERSDGALLARHPDLPTIATDLDSPFLAGLHRGRTMGAGEMNGRDGVQRIYGFRQNDNLPIVSLAGINTDVTEANWAQRLALAGTITLIAMLGLVAFAVAAFRNAQGEIRLSLALERSNGTLATRVRESTRQLREALVQSQALLHQKELLLREVHHRVKNNLQIVSTLLFMDPRIGQAGVEASRRVQSMALVHEFLYDENNVGLVRLDAYLKELARRIIASFGANDKIRLHGRSSPVYLRGEFAVPVALIANEVITNSIKHAFSEGRSGAISIEAEPNADGVLLVIADDGAGSSSDAAPAEPAGTGKQIVDLLAAQLGATYRLDHRANGTRFELLLPPPTIGLTPAPPSPAQVESPAAE